MNDAEYNPPVGAVIPLEPGLEMIVAPNPSPMTFRGTNTYILGDTDIAIVDPGPISETHLSAILTAINGRKVRCIIVTHSHLDHSPLARPLAKVTRAPVLAFGDASAGRSPIMQRLAQEGMAGGGEGIDVHFSPDDTVEDGSLITGSDWSLRVIHTPGHTGNHIALGWSDACLTADHVMAWSTSLVSPPDGDLTDFMASCEKLHQNDWRVFYPGHGPQVENPTDRLHWLIAHRRAREAAIVDALGNGPSSAAAIAENVYVDTPAALLPAATRNVFAHLVDLHGRGIVAARAGISPDGEFSLLGSAQP